MKPMAMGWVLVAGAMLVTPGTTPAQVVVGGEWECEEGSEKGELGISGLDCRGECTLTLNERGEEQAWSFTVEPRINGITRGGPADGVLRVDDVLVAVDGVLITTREGGIRYANIEPGEAVTIRFRREGQLATATIQAGSTCPPPPPPVADPAPIPGVVADVPPMPPRTVTVGRLVPPPPPDTVDPDMVPPGRRSLGIAVAPRVRVTTRVDTVAGRNVARARPVPEVDVRPVRAPRPGVPEGRLGISFTCSNCTGNIQDGVQLWDFSGPIEVTGVDAGGPADEAGIQLGDQITAVNGGRIESRQGGEDFSRMTPENPIELTVVKRNGREQTVTVVPVTAETLAQARRVVTTSGVSRRAVAAPPARTTPPLRPAVPDRAEVPAPTAGVTAPEGMPLRYSGVLEGVEVEVRGNPVTVSELRGVRTIYINAEGLWIRITIPREREVLSGETVGLESRIR